MESTPPTVWDLLDEHWESQGTTTWSHLVEAVGGEYIHAEEVGTCFDDSVTVLRFNKLEFAEWRGFAVELIFSGYWKYLPGPDIVYRVRLWARAKADVVLEWLRHPDGAVTITLNGLQGRPAQSEIAFALRGLKLLAEQPRRGRKPLDQTEGETWRDRTLQAIATKKAHPEFTWKQVAARHNFSPKTLYRHRQRLRSLS